MFRIPQVLACSLVLSFNFIFADLSAAQSLPQPDGYDTLTPAVTVPAAPYDFAILGMRPGMPIEDALSMAEQHLGEGLLPVGGTLQVTSPSGRAFRTELRVAYETPEIDFFLRNQSAQPYENIQIDVSTPATGSVVTAIRREVRVPASEGPDAAARARSWKGFTARRPRSRHRCRTRHGCGLCICAMRRSPCPSPMIQRHTAPAIAVFRVTGVMNTA